MVYSFAKLRKYTLFYVCFTNISKRYCKTKLILLAELSPLVSVNQIASIEINNKRGDLFNIR